jgi:hypothetical protein
MVVGRCDEWSWANEVDSRGLTNVISGHGQKDVRSGRGPADVVDGRRPLWGIVIDQTNWEIMLLP